MKQTSPSSASSVAAATCFVPTIAVFAWDCVASFRDSSVPCCLSRPPGPLPPRPRDLEPLPAPALELGWPSIRPEGGAPPRPRRRPPRPWPEDPGAVGGLSAMAQMIKARSGATVRGQWQIAKSCGTQSLWMMSWEKMSRENSLTDPLCVNITRIRRQCNTTTTVKIKI